MNFLVIVLFCLLWLHSSFAVPKWEDVASGETSVDGLEPLKDFDFSDMHFNTTVGKLVEDALAERFPKADCGKESHLESKTGEEETPCLLWIGFRMVRFAYLLWYFALLLSLYNKKNLVTNLHLDDETSEQDPASEDYPEIPIVADDDVPEDARVSVVNIVNEMKGDIVVIEEMLQIMGDFIDKEEKKATLDREDLEPTELILPVRQNSDGGSSSKSSETTNIEVVHGKSSDLVNREVKESEEEVIAAESSSSAIDSLSAEMDSSSSTSDSSSSTTDSSSDSSLSMDTIRRQFLVKPDEIKDQGEKFQEDAQEELPGEESASSEQGSSGKTTKSRNIFQRVFRALKSQKKYPGMKTKEPVSTKEEWLKVMNQVWAAEQDRPSGYQPRVSFLDQVEVKTFLVRRPMNRFDTVSTEGSGPSEINQMQPLRSEGESPEIGPLPTRNCFRHRVKRWILRLKN